MNTVIRVLVIVITLLGATALTFAILNFNKRQNLLSRVSTLVEQVVKVSGTLEAQDAPEVDPLKKMMDISPVSDRVSDVVDEKNVFEDYAAHFEAQNLTKLNFAPQEKKDQLNMLYAIDEEGKIKKTAMGLPITEGPGTMKELLDQMLDRANAQSATLNKTRALLTKTREQVEEGVDAINTLKRDARVEQKKLTDAREEIVGLKDERTQLQGEVAKLSSEKRELEADLADTKNEVELLQEAQAKLNDQLVGKEAIISNLFDRIAQMTLKPVEGTELFGLPALTAGDKGKVIETNDEYKFVIIEFSPDAMMEMLGAEREKSLPPLHMNVRRLGRESAGGDFVSKVKLRNSVKDKNLVVADILADWQQVPLEKGDVIFY